MSLRFLKEKLALEPQENYPTTSRVHPLNSFSKNCFVKREDELGFGISGSKYRKYRTLIPFLCAQNCNEVVILGGAFSNHVLGISQLLIEKGLKVTLFLKGERPQEAKGNFLYLQKLIPDNQMLFIPKREWGQALNKAHAYAGPRTFVLEEGASLFPAFLGVLMLPLDILRNEQEIGLHFDHLFIDAGTGLTAVALLLAFTFLNKSIECHILLVADTESAFRKCLAEMHARFENWLGHPCPFPKNFTCSLPTCAKSFGSTNTEMMKFINETAQKEGLFLDPIYSAKLFYHAKKLLLRQKLEGNTLLLHSGGALSLSGFDF